MQSGSKVASAAPKLRYEPSTRIQRPRTCAGSFLPPSGWIAPEQVAIRLLAGRRFSPNGENVRGVRLAYGNLDETEMAAALARLGGAVRYSR
jgi:hypothetical protein